FDRSQISFHKLQRRGSAVKTSFSQNRGYDVYTYIFGDETPYANSTKVEIKFQEGQANGFGKIKGNATFGEIYKSNDCVRLSNPF
ncbi:MAG: hypothetical protein ACOYOK_11435, partial [Pseudobdellovibrionaceae bacterium]